MARELHEMLGFQKDRHILQKEAFHASFRSTEFSEKNSDVIIILKIEKALSKENNKSQKRADTKLQSESDAHDFKRLILKCSVCDMSKHNLSEC